jgi:hypothetical protein
MGDVANDYLTANSTITLMTLASMTVNRVVSRL